MILLLVTNFFWGRFLHLHSNRWLLIVSVGINILILAIFKASESDQLRQYGSFLGIDSGNIPAGLSFITFTSVAFLLDSFFKRQGEYPEFIQYFVAQLFFSKVIAGPIVRIKPLLKVSSLSPSLQDFAGGIRRFARGFLKKVLVADVLGAVVDPIFGLTNEDRSMVLAWIGLLFYTLQILFDFSGYTDMALGVGKMFGVALPENFNYPYISKSISEFWRRWHITLSNWFRDYLFFPLERKRKGFRMWSQQINVLAVFLLTGLWHGFTINFLLWGLIHGGMITIENCRIGRKLRKKMPVGVQHLYTLVVILIGWVLFRTNSLTDTIDYFHSLMKLDHFWSDISVSTLQPIEGMTWFAFIIGIILCTPISKTIDNKVENKFITFNWIKLAWKAVGDLALMSAFILAITVQFESSFSTFLYGNF